MRVLIVANGEPPLPEQLYKAAEEADFVIAADGAAKLFTEQNLVPDLLVGDFDSAAQSDVEDLIHQGVPTVKLPCEKDATDTMAAINLAKQHGATEGKLLGATGKRVDHLLANLVLLPYAKELGIDLCIEDATSSIFLREGKVKLTGKAGQTVSLFPINGKARVYCTDGLKYPLNWLILTQENPVWVSNELTKPEITLMIEGQVLVLMIHE